MVDDTQLCKLIGSFIDRACCVLPGLCIALVVLFPYLIGEFGEFAEFSLLDTAVDY